MAKVKKFEEIESWKRARSLTKKIYDATVTGRFAKDFGLRDQIRRAAISILSNIAEGFERGGDKEFQQFLSVAKGSSGELRAQLYVARDQQYISVEAFKELSGDAAEISRLISSFMRYLKQSEFRGSKLK